MNLPLFAANGERVANLAVKETVYLRGQEAPRSLYQAFDTFNREHFTEQLKPALLLLTPPATPRNYGDYIAQDVHGLRARIRIRPSLVGHEHDPQNVFAMDVLLHEMVHGWCHEVAGQPEDGYRGHGPVFARKCNEIGAKCGLPEVFVRSKKNKGKPLCNYWPHIVRPEGFYPWRPSTKGRLSATTVAPADQHWADQIPRSVLVLYVEVLDRAHGLVDDVLAGFEPPREQLDELRNHIGDLLDSLPADAPDWLRRPYRSTEAS